MVTEYNRNVIMRRRSEAAMAAEELKNSGATAAADTKPADAAPVSSEAGKTEVKEEKVSDKQKKTDAEKLGKKKRS